MTVPTDTTAGTSTVEKGVVTPGIVADDTKPPVTPAVVPEKTPEKTPEKAPEKKEGETLIGGDAKTKNEDGTLIGGDAKIEDKTDPAAPKKGDEKVEVKASDLNLPEGTLLSDGSMEEIAAFAKAQGFSKEQTQATLEAQSKSVSDYVDSQRVALKDQSKQWIADLKADKEVGGEKFLENVGLVDRLSKRIFDDDFRAELNETGLGNHPKLFKGLLKAAQGMGEDKPVKGTSPSSTPKTAAQIMYPQHYNDDGTPKKGD